MFGLIVAALLFNFIAFTNKQLTKVQIVNIWMFTIAFQYLCDIYIIFKYHGYWYFTKGVDWESLPAITVWYQVNIVDTIFSSTALSLGGLFSRTEVELLYVNEEENVCLALSLPSYSSTYVRIQMVINSHWLNEFFWSYRRLRYIHRFLFLLVPSCYISLNK